MSPRAIGIVATLAAGGVLLAAWMSGIRAPAWVFPAAIVILLGFYVNGVTERVPLYLSNATTQAAVASLMPIGSGRRFIDLGCGFGGVVLAAAQARPEATVQGVETAPLSWLICKLRLAASGLENADVAFRSIWDTDISEADVVYAFLSPAPMAKLYAKAKREMKPGSLFVSNSFEVPDVEPDEVIEVDDRRETRLLVWKM